MWTATTRGFFSAVQHRDDPSLLVVRTRDHSDAQTLVAWYAAWQTDMAKIAHALSGKPAPVEGPAPAITTYEWSDYPWRVIMPRSAWGAFMAETVEDLDYGNFKDAVKHEQGADRAGVYTRVWSALLALEDLDPMGRRPKVQEDEPWDLYDDWEARTDEPFTWEDERWQDFVATDPSPAEVTRYLNEHP